MKKKQYGQRSERGSYTVEATISLTAFMIAIAFIYLQVRAMICENMMQNVANNLALEMSTYTYILDKAGLIAEHADEELATMNAAVEAGETVVASGNQLYKDAQAMVSGFPEKIGDFAALLGSLYNDGKGGIADSIKTLADSLQGLGTALQNVNWTGESKVALRNAVETAIKKVINEILEDFYLYRMNSYLPGERSSFCKSYWINEESISFEKSRFLPDKDNNSIAVIVTYETVSPFKSLPIGSRTVTKCAYTAAWVESNTN